jgi:hypothetical protein
MSDDTRQQPSSTATAGSAADDGFGRKDADPSWLSPEHANGLWRVEIALRVRDLWHRLLDARARVVIADAKGEETDVVAAVPLDDGTAVSVHLHRSVKTGAPANAPAWSSHFHAAQDALGVADRSIRLPKGSGRLWETVKEWWTGTKVTAAWESVHSAEAELVAIGSDADVKSALPGLWSWMQQAMTEAERASYKDKMEAVLSGKEALDRNLIHQAYEDVIRANNDMHTGMRSFRNTLLIVSFGLTALLVLSGIWHAAEPHVLSFCTGTGTSTKCPGGGTTSAAGIVFEIELVGALGGLLAAAFLIGEFKTAPSRYNLLSGQLMLKIAAGAAAAILAILFLQSGLIVQPSKDVTTIEVVLGYAALFGFSQQLLTRLVDKRASALIEGQEEGKSEKGETKK